MSWQLASLALLGAVLAVLARASVRRSAVAEAVSVDRTSRTRLQPADAV